ncbi:hypothetical protein DFJ74DRAFT_686729 [Hyaloraphidium curvatum]|nr:hypothetical protein DFJ74DRAFT_686729 [Hyaloraphidium curvatum]
MKVTFTALVRLALFATLARSAAGVPTGLEVAISESADSDVENVRFVEACGGCKPEEYCEAAYPGAPEGSLACVSYPTARHLYRRYTYSACKTDTYCSGGDPADPPNDPSANTLAKCRTACAASTSCLIYSWDSSGSCDFYTTCIGYSPGDAGSEIGVRSDQTCPCGGLSQLCCAGNTCNTAAGYTCPGPGQTCVICGVATTPCCNGFVAPPAGSTCRTGNHCDSNAGDGTGKCVKD